MFYRFKFFEDKTLLKVMVYGKADPQSMRSRLALLANDHRWKSEYKLLIDYSNVTTIDAPREFGKTLKDLLKELPEARLPVGIAYVFPERLFCQCFDAEQSTFRLGAQCHVQFFRQEGPAVEWLEALAAAGSAAEEAG